MFDRNLNVLTFVIGSDHESRDLAAILLNITLTCSAWASVDKEVTLGRRNFVEHLTGYNLYTRDKLND